MTSKLDQFRPPGCKIKFTTTRDNFKIRYATWSKGKFGTIFFLNGRTEYIEKYSETIKKQDDKIKVNVFLFFFEK